MDGTEFFKRNVQKWVRMFKGGRTETSEGRGGAHNVHSAHEERVAEIERRMAERRDCTIAELARETGIPATTVGRVVSKELKMVKKMCVWPCDFNRFGQMKVRRSGKRFDNWSIAEMDVNSILSAYVEGKKLLGVQVLSGRWERVVNNGGAYPTEH
nr:unnamed protein product [Haemonchus contortus]